METCVISVVVILKDSNFNIHAGDVFITSLTSLTL